MKIIIVAVIPITWDQLGLSSKEDNPSLESDESKFSRLPISEIQILL